MLLKKRIGMLVTSLVLMSTVMVGSPSSAQQAPQPECGEEGGICLPSEACPTGYFCALVLRDDGSPYVRAAVHVHYMVTMAERDGDGNFVRNEDGNVVVEGDVSSFGRIGLETDPTTLVTTYPVTDGNGYLYMPIPENGQEALNDPDRKLHIAARVQIPTGYWNSQLRNSIESVEFTNHSNAQNGIYDVTNDPRFFLVDNGQGNGGATESVDTWSELRDKVYANPPTASAVMQWRKAGNTTSGTFRETNLWVDIWEDSLNSEGELLDDPTIFHATVNFHSQP